MYNADTQYYIQWNESDLKEDFELVYEDIEKYMIAIKDDSSNGYYEMGHCFQCKVEDDKVTLANDMIWWTYAIPIEQFEDDFIVMSKEEYDLYIELSQKGEDRLFEAILRKYVDSYISLNDKKIEGHWMELENITFDENADGELVISENWLHFGKGTSREDIWHWFDQNHSKGVHYLLNTEIE